MKLSKYVSPQFRIERFSIPEQVSGLQIENKFSLLEGD